MSSELVSCRGEGLGSESGSASVSLVGSKVEETAAGGEVVDDDESAGVGVASGPCAEGGSRSCPSSGCCTVSTMSSG
jgi:hypothetical protein